VCLSEQATRSERLTSNGNRIKNKIVMLKWFIVIRRSRNGQDRMRSEKNGKDRMRSEKNPGRTHDVQERTKRNKNI
jgi:hypothetical protein